MVLWERSHCGPIGPAGWRDHVVVLWPPRGGEIVLWFYLPCGNWINADLVTVRGYTIAKQVLNLFNGTASGLEIHKEVNTFRKRMK